MDDSLRLIVNQLATAGDAALQNDPDMMSAVRAQISVKQFLDTVQVMDLSSDQFVSLICSVFKCASVEWLILEIGRDNQEESTESYVIEQLYADLTTAMCRHACVPSLANEEEMCADLSKEFVEKARIACAAMTTFSHLLSNLSSHNSCREELQQRCNRTVKRVIRAVSHGVVVICLEHEQAFRWTTTQSIECARTLLAHVCAAYGCNSLESLLNMNDGRFGLLQRVLNEVLPKLTKSTWKLNPAASHVFRRCLLATQQPLLSDCLPMFLPPTFLFVDDFEVDNRLSGLSCLRPPRHAALQPD